MNDTVEKFLNRILKTCEGKNYLFRGTTKRYSKKGAKEINSSRYRWAKNRDVTFHEKYSPFNIEKDILLEKAKRHSVDSASNIEILTDLQHYHGKTNLIDFSRNLYIALFFACNGEHHEDGELLLLDSDKIEEKPDILYEDLKPSSDPFLIEPADTPISQKRVTFQSSVFVYPPSGYINKDLCEIIPVPANLKRPVLDHLQKIHNIHIGTVYSDGPVYNDLISFIDNEKDYEIASVLFYQGLVSHNKGEYEEAIEKYDEAIELNSNYAEFYNNRGVAKNNLGQYLEAIADYNKVIELNPNDAMAYSNRGNAKDELGQHQEAIIDFNKAIELNPNYAEAYNNRGNAKNELGKYTEAISDLNKALELNPVLVEAYNNRGIAKDKLGQYQESIADCGKAIELDPNYAIAYNNRGNAKGNLGLLQEAISDFDKAIELDPNNAPIYVNRGVANQALGRTHEADEDFKMATKLKGD